MTSSAQLERQAEERRAQIAETLDELRSRMTAGQIVDQLSEYVSEGSAGAFLRNLRAQSVANPVPVTFVGVGLAWLMLSGFREPRHQGSSKLRSAPRDVSRKASRSASDDFSQAAAEAGNRTRRAARQFGDEVKQGASDLADNAADYGDDAQRAARDFRDSISDATKSGYEKAAAGYHSMAEGLSETYDSAADQAHEMANSIGQTASDMRDSVSSAGNGVARILREQPLVLAGLGLAIGGLLGAYLPTTELEEKVMGKASDKLKGKIRDTASETLAKGKAVADRALQEAREEALDQGILPSKNAGKDQPEASLVPEGQGSKEQVPGGA
jgi:hypothetical protein